LCNTGEEAFAYIQFIVDHYDDLPDVTFFVQGNHNTFYYNSIVDNYEFS